ncbi:ABC transporter substrate-binding protein [Mycobacterium sp. ITM-2016-00318]|uniref:ABC transporter substrate-binding protein n=1 Tax=Mycobacterium sp. ITM-2016-00318 TaxID=2099693 RepID=UPI000CF96C54|nr:ABC transporter substrate-binding protein [Mycobacterium sp. ITM-2016-00318]WNG91918.1 ABC transporter substrate-binding protein [Mycobacterium sp. ITM-2016-00318]
MKRYWIILLVVVLAACGGGGQKGNFSEATDRLEVVSWWVSPSEHPAFEVLLNAFKAANPDVETVDGTIAGGGGSNVQVALAARLQAGDPPDVWQTFLGSSLRAWVNADRIVDVSGVYESSGLDRTMPQALLDAATYRVKAWGVPTGSHRGNVLWFNQRMLRDAGVRAPGPGYTTEAFQADLAKVAASGKTALCLGGKDRFTKTELFENTLLGVVGTEGWSRIGDDSFDWRGAQLRQALTQFGDIVSLADPDAPGVTWDQAAKKMATGQCAFLSMNDSVYGELVANQAVEGEDFGYVAYPGTSGSYLAIVDTFVVSADAEDGVNAMKFLETIADPKTSLEFNKLKGSVPIRDDVDVASLPPYQRQASKSLFSDKILLSMTHGEVMSTNFQQALYDAVASYASSKNADGFIDTMQNSIEVPIVGR